jgi:aryl-alcohol dehydrogenase-like predicted oxidoreductase
MFDTADVYGGAQNEVFVGKALANVRDRVQIATRSGSPGPAAAARDRAAARAVRWASMVRRRTCTRRAMRRSDG